MILITEREECEKYGVDEALLQAAGKAVEERFSLQKDLFETEITFLSEEEIRELNAQTRGVDAVTDVLSYPYLECAGEGAPVYGQMDINPETEKVTLGSIAFCMARVKEQAAEYGHSLERELHYLLTHGVLHCLGYDHMTDEDKAEMRQKEEYVLGKLGIVRE